MWKKHEVFILRVCVAVLFLICVCMCIFRNDNHSRLSTRSIYEDGTSCSEDHVISKQDFRKYFSRLYTAKP